MARALEDVKIVELGELVSAPYASKLMADMGAEVIKIERPGAGDRARTRGPFPGGKPNPETSGLFLYLNTNKLGVTLDVATAEGFEIFEKLIAGADILIHNVVPPEMDRIGLTYERLSKINPRLIMTSITPWGMTGPYRNWRAEELTVWAAGGICVLNGAGPKFPDLPPLKAFGHQAGFQGGVHAAAVTMGALLGRLRDGTAQHIDVSVQEVVAALGELAFEQWPYVGLIASRLGQRPVQPIAILQCKDGYIFLCCIEEHQWRAYVDLMGNPEWANEEIFADGFRRAASWDALEIFLQEHASQQSVLDLYLRASEKRIPVSPVSTMGDLVNSEHLRVRGFFVEITQPVAGTHLYPGAPLKCHGTPWEIRMPAPTLGQHNQQVFCGRLGIGAARLAALKGKGIV
jgi:crotonobetainyl-CoA:carnitine CoA-transferase CaiB-like acyl-CoA transferase